MGKSFKVLICGAGVSGLSLALMLERLGIDYLVLEAYPEVTANVGAAVCLLPNGLRVLDQLGVYDSFKEQYDQGPPTDAKFFSPEGQVLGAFEMNDLIRWIGYPMIFLSRRSCMETLYSHIKHKDRILVNKRVAKIIRATSGVEVMTEDGTIYRGDVLAGGDGIHSAVRKEMWRLGAELKPGYFPENEWSSVPCYQKCIFGISTPPPNFKVQGGMMTYNNGFVLSLLPGVDNRLYWFFFLNLDQPAYGRDAPRFTKDDEARLVKEHLNDPVMPGLKLGDLYSRAEVTVMTALQEHVFKKWHFQRIITFGDAAHKFNPETGQGANSAIETAAAIANELSRLLKKTSSPSDDDISAAFSRVQEQRFDRVKTLVGRATAAGRADSFTTPMDELVARHVMPHMDPVTSLSGLMDEFVGGARLENMPVPFKPKLVPFSDELPSRPLRAVASKTVTALVALLLATMAFHATREGEWGTWPGPTAMIPPSWASEAVSSDSTNTLIYNVLVYGTIFFMWTLDGQRIGNGSSVARWPFIFLLASQLLDPAIIVPTYLALSALMPTFWTTAGRELPLNTWRDLPVALGMGFVLPTALLLVSPIARPLWLLAPVLVPSFLFGIRFWNKRLAGFQRLASEQLEVIKGAENTLSTVAAAPDVVCGLVVSLLAAANLSILSAVDFSDLSGIPDALVSHTQLAILAVSVFVYSLYCVFQLRRRGYISTAQLAGCSASVLVGSVVLGPAATYVGTSWFADRTISGVLKSVNTPK